MSGLLPRHKLDKKTKNPTWRTDLEVEIVRQDTTLSLTEHVGQITDKDGKHVCDISKSIGHPVYHLTFKDMRVAVNFHDALLYVAKNLAKDIRKPKKSPLPKRR